jgi:hypothetical protein
MLKKHDAIVAKRSNIKLYVLPQPAKCCKHVNFQNPFECIILTIAPLQLIFQHQSILVMPPWAFGVEIHISMSRAIVWQKGDRSWKFSWAQKIIKNPKDAHAVHEGNLMTKSQSSKNSSMIS